MSRRRPPSTASVFLAALVLTPMAFAHGGGHRRPPPGAPPTGGVPPGLRPPPVDPKPPTTPPGTPPPVTPPTTPPGGPKTPPSGPGGPTTPPGGRIRRTGPNPRTGTVASDPDSWRVWWEYNREHLLGLRARIRRSGRGAVTGTPGADALDPLAARRPEVRAALRSLVLARGTHYKLKQSIFIALGRVGSTDDLDLFEAAIADRHLHEDARTAALLGLGLLPPLDDPAARGRALSSLQLGMRGGPEVERRVRGFAFIAAGLRARRDAQAAQLLMAECASKAWDSQDAAARVYACGITGDPMLLAEILLAARQDRHGGQRLHDLGRSHAVGALGLVSSPLSFDLLVKLLRSRRAGTQTRRAAALSLGRLMREGEFDDVRFMQGRDALQQAFDKGRDTIVRAYAAVGLGGARRPLGVPRLREAIDHGGNQELKHYAALGLGLAARALDGNEARAVRRFLVEELDKANDIELQSALAIAVGLAGAADAERELQRRVAKGSLPAPVRGAAAEALGLMGSPGSESGDLLVEAVRKGPPALVEGAAIGLALLGRRGVAPILVERLSNESAGIVQGSLTMALGHLGQGSAVDPLLETLKDPRAKRVVRELAAVALGMLCGRDDPDPLFDLDAYFNYFATTQVTHELLTIF